jgi:hypothetical protein
MKSIVTINEDLNKIIDIFITANIDFETQLVSKNRYRYIFTNINIMLEAIELLEKENIKYYTIL